MLSTVKQRTREIINVHIEAQCFSGKWCFTRERAVAGSTLQRHFAVSLRVIFCVLFIYNVLLVLSLIVEETIKGLCRNKTILLDLRIACVYESTRVSQIHLSSWYSFHRESDEAQTSLRIRAVPSKFTLLAYHILEWLKLKH